MMLEIARRFGCCWAAALPLLAACSADVDLYRMLAGRGAAGSVAGAAAATPPAPAPADSSSNSTNILITPDSVPTSTDEGCQPGHYVGDFSGTYNSAAVINGTVPLSIAATSSLGRPGLEFWLERVANNCGDEEFCADFTLKGGKIRGFANPFSDGDAPSGDAADDALVAIRFEIDFAGDLDCSRGQFQGRLQNGCYDVATVLFRFEGTAPADYDPASSSFINGQWDVKEMPSADAWFPPDANIGGMGTWQAGLAHDDVAPAAEGGGLCDM